MYLLPAISGGCKTGVCYAKTGRSYPEMCTGSGRKSDVWRTICSEGMQRLAGCSRVYRGGRAHSWRFDGGVAAISLVCDYQVEAFNKDEVILIIDRGGLKLQQPKMFRKPISGCGREWSNIGKCTVVCVGRGFPGTQDAN